MLIAVVLFTVIPAMTTEAPAKDQTKAADKQLTPAVEQSETAATAANKQEPVINTQTPKEEPKTSPSATTAEIKPQSTQSVPQPMQTTAKPAPKPLKPQGGLYINAAAESYRDLVAQYDWPVDQALAIMTCESGGNPEAVNWGDAKITGMPSSGLFQINALLNWDWNSPAANIARAHEMYSRRGWRPWSCAKKIGLVK